MKSCVVVRCTLPPLRCVAVNGLIFLTVLKCIQMASWWPPHTFTARSVRFVVSLRFGLKLFSPVFCFVFRFILFRLKRPLCFISFGSSWFRFVMF